MSLSALSSTDSQAHSQTFTVPCWGAWSAILIVGCFYLTQVVGIFMVNAVAMIGVAFSQGEIGYSNLEIWLLPLSLCVGTIGGVMLSLQVATSRAKLPKDFEWLWSFIRQSYDLSRLWRFVLSGVGLGIGFFALTEYGVLPPDDLPQPLFDAMSNSPPLLMLGWLIIFVGLFPVVEEVLFRGFLFTGLSQSWGPTLAAIVTTALFVGVHMPKVLYYWPALVVVTLIGLFTVLIRIRTGSLVPGMALHSAYNGTLVCVALLSESSSPGS